MVKNFHIWPNFIPYFGQNPFRYSAENYFVILQKEYTYLKSKELEELPLFRVMSWQPS